MLTAAILARHTERVACLLYTLRDRLPAADRIPSPLPPVASTDSTTTPLAAGWPIAIGAFEGACRHLIADRLDITAPAEAVLQLGTVIDPPAGPDRLQMAP